MKNPLIEAYNNIANKTQIKYPKDIYNQYVLEPIAQIYIDKEDDRSQRESETLEEPTPEISDKKDESLTDELKNNAIKTVVNTLTGQGLNFDKIKIDENLLKKNILKVRYINSNRRVNNKFLKEDYKISNNMKNSVLKNTNLNKLSKNEYDVYNTLQRCKVDVNKLRHEFKSPIRFDNSFISLTQAVFYNFFHNVKQSYEMKVKKDNTFYNISLIDAMLEVEDINKIINDELIRHKLLTDDDPLIISIIADIKTFKIIILVERGYELHLDDNFAKMFGFSEKILKRIYKEVI